jgi:PAS domain S-box-containing protein
MENARSNLNDPLQSMALFAEMNPEPVIRFDASGKILQSNPSANKLFNKEELLGDNIIDILPEFEQADLVNIIENDQVETFHIRIEEKDYNFVFRGISEYNVCQIYGFNITAKIKAQEKAESMALFAQKNPAPVFRFDLEGNVLQANEAADDIFQLVCNDRVDIYNFFSNIDREKVSELINKNEIHSFVEHFRDYYFRFELRGISEIDAVQVYGADITEIVKAQYENEKLSTAVQQSSNSVEITDINGNLEFINKAFEDITGYSAKEVLGKNPRILKTDYHSKEFYKELWDTIKSGNVWKGEFYNRRKDGSKLWEEASITPIKDNENVIRNFIAVKEDITERKKAQEQLRSMALFARLNPEPVIRFDKKGVVLQANPAANESFSLDTIEGKQIKELMDELKDFDIKNFIENDQIETIDITNHDKTYRFILKGISEIGVCQIYGSDITKRIEAQKTAESMALFAQLNPEPVFRFNDEGIILQANDAANDLFEKKQIAGELVHELLSGVTELDFRQFIKNNEILTFTEYLDDRILRFKLRGIDHLNVCQIYGSDITSRVKAEQKVRQQKKDIDDSIQYASRIQDAVLPSVDIMDKYLKDYFLIFKPRDVVSGDFYWMNEKDNKLVLVAADCTGHGVPGAFMSMLGVSFLNEIVNSKDLLDAGEILNDLRYLVKTTLSQSGGSKSDGMDLSLVIIDRDSWEMQFAGAYNHLYFFRDGEMSVTKADRMPIGNYIGDEKKFKTHKLPIKEGDTFYILSDGYPDQFDHESKRKFGLKRLKEEFMGIHDQDMKTQQEYLENLFDQWKGDHWQMDDVIMIGARV